MNVEQPAKEILEAELADLSRQIEKRREELEQTRGIIDERDLLKQAVGGRLGERPGTTAKQSDDDSYLSALDDSTVTAVNDLISQVATAGINKVIDQAKTADPIVLDAFHDALVDRLYEELKERGWIK